MIYSICGFNIEYEPRFERLKSRSEKYLAEDQSVKVDFSFDVSDEEIKKHQKKYVADDDLAEYVIAGMKFYEEIISRNAFILHSSAVAVDGNGYAFTGYCGAGKSTHAGLWREYFSHRLISVNDDKPVIKLDGDSVSICGTPFSGKNDINANISVPLRGICLIEQAKENSIEKLSAAEAIPVMLEQTLRPNDMIKMEELFRMLDVVLKTIPVYRLRCNISFEAVKLAFDRMSEK